MKIRDGVSASGVGIPGIHVPVCRLPQISSVPQLTCLPQLSVLRVECLVDGVLKGVAFAELVVVVFRLVPVFEVEVVVCEEVVVVLGADYFGLQLLLDVLVGVEVGGLVLAQLVVVVLVVEVFGAQVVALGQRVSELVHYLLETSLGLLTHLLCEWRVGVNLQQLDLLVDVVHGLLQVALLAVGGEVEWLEGRKGSHELLVAEHSLALAPHLPADRLELLP